MTRTPRRAIPPTLPSDALSSLVVFLVALPLCLGIAVASGVPPALGLVTGIVGGLVVGAVQSSPFSVSGPAAGLTVLVVMIVRDHGLVFLSAVVLGAGVLQVGAGLLRGGRWFRAVPPAVVHGMLAGIGVLIAAGQAHALLGNETGGGGLANLAGLPGALLGAVEGGRSAGRSGAALVGAVTIVVMLVWPRIAPRRLRILPAPLLAVAAGTVAVEALGLSVAHVGVPDSLLSALALPGRETLSHFLAPKTWLTALELALVASAETLLCSAAVDQLHRGRRTDYDRELFAQGLGNATCGALGALPMTAVIVRSSANVAAGARTRLSTMFHALWLLATVALAPGLIRLVPMASLAAVLVVVGIKLVDGAALRKLARLGRGEVAVYGVTLAGVVATDLLRGVLAGITLSAVLLLWRLTHLRIDVEHDTDGRRSVLSLRGSATFLRLPELAEALESIPPDRELHLHLDNLAHLDHAARALIESWERSHRERGGEVVVDLGERARPGPQVGGRR